MSLPDSRNTDYTPVTKVKSADLNDMQDSIWKAAHGAIVDVYHPAGFNFGLNTTLHASGYVAYSAAGACSLGPRVRTGDRVTSVLLRVWGNGVSQFAVNVWVMAASGALTNIGPGAGAVNLTPGAAWTDLTVDVTDTTLGAGESLWITAETSGGGCRVGNISLSRKHPL